ncbi:hypothetical protein OG792_25150 [Micromonospora sp. NBC_01699]|uniref:methyltransferase domain-containing protein n=1 Tax=Micromonospora sp. NBC_01699 TaxID=2975984 RepID=UPI002E28B659|nr:methyltransferase domain-containing protein [Micromonospora sp. NBC_01699]
MAVFYDPDESEFYGRCAERFLDRDVRSGHVVELGAGNAEAICTALERSRFDGLVHGYEISEDSVTVGRSNIAVRGLEHRYRVRHGDFFAFTEEQLAVPFMMTNPPYLTCPVGDPAFPHLAAGPTGTAVSDRVLSAHFTGILMMVSSYANPLHTLALARRHGYIMVDWRVQRLTMGRYSAAPTVQQGIRLLAEQGRAFVSGDRYLLAGVVWHRSSNHVADRSHELATALRAFDAQRSARLPS